MFFTTIRFGPNKILRRDKLSMERTSEFIVPPPLDPAWDVAQAIRTFHETYSLFEPPVAGRMAVEIMQNQIGQHGPVTNVENDDADHFHAMQYHFDGPTLNDPVSNSSSTDAVS